MSIVRTSLRPLSAADSEPVKVRHHDQAEEDLGEPLGRIEHPPAPSLIGDAGGSTDVIVASIAYFSSSVTVQPSFGLKLFIPAAIFAVSGPRSFW